MFGIRFYAPVITICEQTANNFFYDLNFQLNFPLDDCIRYYTISNFKVISYGNSDFFDRQMGLLTPLSHVPHMVGLLYVILIIIYQ